MIADTERRVRWLTEATEYEEDGNTRFCESLDGASPRMPVPDDPVLRAALALIDRYGLWSDPVLSPETLVELVETVLAAQYDGSDG